VSTPTREVELLSPEAARVVDRLIHELQPRFAERVAPESLRVLIDAELSRWEECTVQDYVPIFVSRRVRARLGELAPGY
jgi:hypothetical protein